MFLATQNDAYGAALTLNMSVAVVRVLPVNGVDHFWLLFVCAQAVRGVLILDFFLTLKCIVL